MYEIGMRSDGIGWWGKDGMDGGELVYENGVLVDYDGCYQLPKEVCELVKQAGYALAEFIEEVE